MSAMSNTHHRRPDRKLLAESLGVLVHDRMPVETQCELVIALIDQQMGTRRLASTLAYLHSTDDDRLQILVDDADRAIAAFNDWLPVGYYAEQADGEFWLCIDPDYPPLQAVHGPADERYAAPA